MAAWQQFCYRNMRDRQIMIDGIRYRVITHVRDGVWKLWSQRGHEERLVELDWDGRVKHGRYGSRSPKREKILAALAQRAPLDGQQIAAAIGVTSGAITMVLSVMALEGTLTHRTIYGRRHYATSSQVFERFDREQTAERQRRHALTKELDKWHEGKRILKQLKQHLSPSPSRRKASTPEPTSRA